MEPQWSARTIWMELTAVEQAQAATAYLKHTAKDERGDLYEHLARSMNFRIDTVRKASEKKIATYIVARGTLLGAEIAAVLRAFRIVCKLDLGNAFLGAVGIKHVTGVFSSDDVTFPSVEEITSAVSAIRPRFEPRDIVLYLKALQVELDGGWAALYPAVESIVADSEIRPAALEEKMSPGGAEDSNDTGVPISRDFTTIDRLLIRTVVASVEGVDGSFNAEEVDDLVDTFVHLNDTRHMSYFHRGLADVLLGREVLTRFPGENATRRQWYFSGALSGLLRTKREPELFALLHREKLTVDEIARENRGARVQVIPPLFKSLIRAGRTDEAVTLAAPGMRDYPPTFWMEVLREAEDELRAGDGVSAQKLLELLLNAPPSLDEEYAPPPVQFVEQVERRFAQSLQKNRELSLAKAIYERLLASGQNADHALIEVDLALVTGGFRALEDVALPAEARDETALIASLECGRAGFKKAANSGGSAATNGRYCLGVLALAQKDWPAAADHFERMLAGMSPSERGHYVRRGILSRTHAYLAAAIAHTVDESRTQQVRELILKALENPKCVLFGFWNELLDLASFVLDENGVQECAEAMVRAGIPVLDKANRRLLRSSRVLRDELMIRAAKPARPMRKRWNDWRSLLDVCLEIRSLEECEKAVSALEEMASRDKGLAKDWLEILLGPDALDGVWEREEVEWEVIRVSESLGLVEEAEDRLKRLCWHKASEDRSEAVAIYDRLVDLGVPADRLRELKARLDALSRAAPQTETSAEEYLKAGGQVIVLVVGGDELEAQGDEAIRQAVRSLYPGVHLDFERTRWSSNFGRQFEELKQRLHSADVVVLSRFIRTNLGRAIRKARQDNPWVSCTARGRNAIQERVLKAVRLGAERRQAGTSSPPLPARRVERGSHL
jgi:hypothetical protein